MGQGDVPGTFWPGHHQHDQNSVHNDGMQQHMHFGYVGASDPSRGSYPVDTRFKSQRHFHPHWNHSAVSGGYSYTHHGFQHHALNGAPQYHPYPPSAAGTAFPSRHVYPSSSSNNNPPGLYQNGPSYDDHRMGGIGSSKRKHAAVSFGGGRENTNRSAGSSSSSHMHSHFVQEKSNVNSTHRWEQHDMYASSSASGSRPVRDEGSTRNVRRRYACDVEARLTGQGASVPFKHPAIHPSSHSGSLDSTCWTFGGVNPSWRHPHVPSAAHWTLPMADFSNFYQGSNPAFCRSTATKFSYEARGYVNHFHGNWIPFDHQSSSENLMRPIQVARHFSQQFPETNRKMHDASGAGPSHGRPPMVSENNSSTRHYRSFQGKVFVPTGRNGGHRISQERRRFLPSDTSGPDGPLTERIVLGDQSAIEGFREIFDQHSNMRLDVDNMTYEELLALGERIGNVCTGLSDEAVSKCLMEVLRHSLSDQEQDEESCAICLEEYEKTDIIGKLRGCGHGYHSCCIKKWLSMKNSCPICKAPAENTDGKGQSDSPL